MRRTVRFVAAVLLLMAMLTIPAAASKPEPVTGTFTSDILWDLAWDVGNRCFAIGESKATFGEGFVGTGLSSFWSVGHGPCPEFPGPFQLDETIRTQGTFTGTVLGSEIGTFAYRCQNVWRADDPETLMMDCNIRSGTGGLSGLHGHFSLFFLPGRFDGEVHFDGK